MTNPSIPREKRSRVLQSQTNSRIRDNLIFKLGVAQADEASLQRKRRPSRGSILGNVNITSEPLKSCENDDKSKDTPSAISPWSISSLFATRPVVSETEPSLSSSLQSSSSSSNDNDNDSMTDMNSTSPCKKLKFNEEVKVCPIPKREEYSKRIKDQLWASPTEMAQMAHRNSIEFAAEGCDWRNCLEDENMYRDVSTNELIHPVHIEQHI